LKFLLFAMLASALLLLGCAGSQPQTPPAAGGNDAPPAPPSSVPPAPGNNATPPPLPDTTTPPSGGNSPVTAVELAAHNTEADCWVAYGGQVYDITNYLPNHKNYQALLVPLCGTSSKFQQAFEGKHGLSKVSVLLSQGVNKGALSG
jgi:hypothetical protein